MHHTKLAKFVALAVFLLVLVATVPVGLVRASSLVLVSGSSPYASCSNGSQSGTNYVNAEVEPYVSVNPKNSSNIVGVWQQDRWSSGGAHGLVAGFSSDGGMTWGETTLPFDACAPGTPSALQYERASDPWVSIGHDGTAYTVSISFNDTNNNKAVAAATSTNGGQTWKNVRVIIADNEGTLQFFNDKESVTADPTKNGVAYVVWDRLELPNGNPDADLHTAAFRGPTMFSKTTDGGKTWSSPSTIVKVPSRQQTIGNQIVVDPKTGTLYDFFDLITPPFNVTAFKAAFIKSTDGGNTWSAPIQVNTNTPSNRPGFTPMVQVNSAGTVGVSFYDFRNLTTQTTTLPTDYWFVTSTNHGASFGNEVHIAGPFDMLTAPNAGGFFVGDYEGLTTIGTTFQPFFVQANSGNRSNRTDVFTTSI